MSVIIWIAGILAALSALGVVFSPQPLYSALSLVMAIGALAVVFLVLNAQFLFVVQLIVYAGAVVVLFVFIIALLSPGAEEPVRIDSRFLIGAVAALGITIAMVVAARNGITFNSHNVFRAQQIGQASDPYHSFSFDQSDLGLVNTAGNVQTVGGQLFTTFLLPFEITSLLLLVAAVGAVYLTRRSPRHTQPVLRQRPRPRRPQPDLEEDRIEVEVG
ncbi:MAG: NADH-quinone oxidoreductase subunit J family protein [Candidatus Dormibacteria bacterium]